MAEERIWDEKTNAREVRIAEDYRDQIDNVSEKEEMYEQYLQKLALSFGPKKNTRKRKYLRRLLKRFKDSTTTLNQSIQNTEKKHERFCDDREEESGWDYYSGQYDKGDYPCDIEFKIIGRKLIFRLVKE